MKYENDITFEQLKVIAKFCKRTKIFENKIEYKRPDGDTFTITNENVEQIKNDLGSYDTNNSFLWFASRWGCDDYFIAPTFKDWDTLKVILKEYNIDYGWYKWSLK